MPSVMMEVPFASVKHAHQGLHICREAGVRHGFDIQRLDVARAGNAHGIVVFLHAPQPFPAGDGLKMLRNNIFDEHIAARDGAPTI